MTEQANSGKRPPPRQLGTESVWLIRIPAFFAIAWRGFFMGGADVVPGVSGGTVALIVGIYEPLITAISRVDRTLLRFLVAGRFREAAEYINLYFLCSLAVGIFTGLCTGIFTINYLLSDEQLRKYTLAAFFGMIFASGLHIARLIRAESWSKRLGYTVTGLTTAAAAYWISSQSNGTPAEPSLVYIFLCASIAICAMILPGISGAMILLLLGVYEHLTDIPTQLLDGENILPGLATIAVFGLGCAVSLICFSKFLRWLLKHYHSLTMAMLCGLLLGGLRKLWPFQVDLTPEIESFRHKSFDVRWPESVTELIVVSSIILIAAALIVAAEYFVGRTSIAKEKSVAA